MKLSLIHQSTNLIWWIWVAFTELSSIIHALDAWQGKARTGRL
jgi:hypothetical protein